MDVPYTKIERLYIGGDWVSSSTGETASIINPATEEPIGFAPLGATKDAELAIAAAREAFDTGPWPRLSFKERATIMQRMHDSLSQRLEDIRRLTIAEAGAPFGLVQVMQTATPLRLFQYGIGKASALEPVTSPPESGPNLVPGEADWIGAVTTVYEPVGVVVGITAYNFPFMLNLSKVGPALLAGNTMVLKPSPFTPFAALMLGEVADEIGLPPGVLNIVTGDVDTAKTLTSHPDVDLVSFTGSDKVGALIAQQAAPTLKRVVMELGGKSALIVRPDADIQRAAMIAVGHMTAHCGQGCALMTRYLVHNSIRSQFVATAKAILGNWPVGDPSNPTTITGPLIRESQRANAEAYVQSGLDAGAKLVAGGRRPPHLKKGFYYEPTLFDEVDNTSKIAQEEIFGPIGVVIGFDTDEEAIRLANESKYGLAGGILSADRAQAYRMSLAVRTGMIWLNGGFGGDMSSHAPFGGYKRSGYGREYGPHWLREYLNEKAINYPIG